MGPPASIHQHTGPQRGSPPTQNFAGVATPHRKPKPTCCTPPGAKGAEEHKLSGLAVEKQAGKRPQPPRTSLYARLRTSPEPKLRIENQSPLAARLPAPKAPRTVDSPASPSKTRIHMPRGCTKTRGSGRHRDHALSVRRHLRILHKHHRKPGHTSYKASSQHRPPREPRDGEGVGESNRYIVASGATV